MPSSRLAAQPLQLRRETAAMPRSWRVPSILEARIGTMNRDFNLLLHMQQNVALLSNGSRARNTLKATVGQSPLGGGTSPQA